VYLPRGFAVLPLAFLVAAGACVAKGGNARDTTIGYTASRSATPLRADSINSNPTSPPQSASRKAAGASTPPPSTGEAQRAGARCALTLVTVMVRKREENGTMTDTLLRAEASRILAGVRGLVKSIDYSPAIRTFRIHLVDTATTPTVEQLIAQLRTTRDVDDVSRDDCTMHTLRPPTSVPSTSSRPPASPPAPPQTLDR
jgi:hypothetical protein